MQFRNNYTLVSIKIKINRSIKTKKYIKDTRNNIILNKSKYNNNKKQRKQKKQQKIKIKALAE